MFTGLWNLRRQHRFTVQDTTESVLHPATPSTRNGPNAESRSSTRETQWVQTCQDFDIYRFRVPWLARLCQWNYWWRFRWNIPWTASFEATGDRREVQCRKWTTWRRDVHRVAESNPNTAKEDSLRYRDISWHNFFSTNFHKLVLILSIY